MRMQIGSRTRAGLAALALACALPARAGDALDLSGDWRFALDREDAGVAAPAGRALASATRAPTQRTRNGRTIVNRRSGSPRRP